jgi:quinol monooxygenase YgiN
VRQSQAMRAILLRITAFFLQAIALTSLLPLVAKHMVGGGAGTFTLLLVSMGCGAVVAALVMPRIRAVMDGDVLVRNGTILQALSMLVVAFAPNIYVAAPAMVINGMAVISVANSLAVSAQLTLPNWVRARGMSVYQVALMGGGGIGAAIWGQVATFSDVRTSLVIASIGGVALMLGVCRYSQRGAIDAEDLTPSKAWKAPDMPPGIQGHDGPVLTTIEYLIDPARAEEFQAVMRETRSSRLRQGALSCELFRDATVPGRYVEHMLDESWIEHLRRFDRVTAYDVALRERRLSFHVGEEVPRLTRSIAEAMD